MTRGFWKRLWDGLAGPPLTPQLREEHRRLILQRTKVGSIAAAIVYIVTIPTYLYFYFPEKFLIGLYISIIASLAAASLYFSPLLQFVRQHYQLPLVVIMAIISTITEATILQFTGGGRGYFFFPYFLLFIAMAIYFPGTFKWILIISGSVVSSYAFSEWLMERDLSDLAFASNLMYLIDAAFLSIVANRIVYRLFVRDRESQMALQEANTKLQELDKAKSAFFANVSHELKTPMTLVVTPLESAMQKAPKEAPEVIVSKQTLETVRHNAYRLSGLISDLLDLTKSEIGKARITPVDIEDPKGYFQAIFDSITPLMKDKGLQFEFVVGEELAPHFFDKSKIDKVVVNLLSNAIKFTPKGGKIIMRVWDDPLPPAGEGGQRPGEGKRGQGVLKIQVSDTGIGIPADKVSQVFERFMQVDASSTRAYGGMGIGLSLVKDFVEHHGGTVDIESELGKGTKFTVSLPRGKEHFKATIVEPFDSAQGEIGKGIELPQATLVETMRESKWEEEEPPSPPGGRGVRGEGGETRPDTVLVVDDLADMRLAVRDVLKSRYRVIFAKDGEEGVQVARAKRPDLIISDVMMPKKDGYGLLQDLKQDPETREIPIILLTAKSGEDSLALGFQFGADDYIPKPFQPKEVTSRVKNLIKARRQKEEIERQRDELEKVNRALKETEAELVQTEKLSTVGLLAAGIAHEINNPAYALTLSLGNIEAWLDELKGEGNRAEAQEKIQHHLKRSQEEIDRIKYIVKTLMGYSNKNREGLTRRPITADIEGTLVLLKHQIDESGVQFHWDKKETDIPLEADHAAINQVLTNLIQNAIQAGGKNIWLTAEGEKESCRIRVRDDGSGMPADVVTHIFEPFFTTKEVGKGSGLGLNIVHRILKAHHGEILVKSEVKKGSEFTLVLPLTQPAEVTLSKIAN